MADASRLQDGCTFARSRARSSRSSATAILANSRRSTSDGPGPRPSSWLRYAATMRRWIILRRFTAAVQALRALISAISGKRREAIPLLRALGFARPETRLGGRGVREIFNIFPSKRLCGNVSHFLALSYTDRAEFVRHSLT